MCRIIFILLISEKKYFPKFKKYLQLQNRKFCEIIVFNFTLKIYLNHHFFHQNLNIFISLCKMKQILFLLEELPQLRIIEVESSDCPHSPEVRLRS